MDKETIQCVSCGCDIEDDRREHDGKSYCNNCFEEQFSLCDHCEEYFEAASLIKINNNWYCEACIANNFVRCCSCETYIPRNDRYYFEATGESYCETCYCANFARCTICEYEYRTEDLDANYHCPNCRGPDNIYPYDYVPNLLYYDKDEPTGEPSDKLYFGIELEVENTQSEDISKTVDNLPNFVYAKEDGSLSDGFEIVSNPATWNWIKANKDKWNSILNIRKQGFRSYDTSTCGMHVHLSRNQFTTLHLYKFLKLFYENGDFILQISRRKKGNLKRWSAVEDDDESIVYKAKEKYVSNKYTAVNLAHNNTIEIRIFRGTLSFAGFWINLEFCKAVFDYTKNALYTKICVPEFCNYIVGNKKDFPNLYEFLKTRGYIFDNIFGDKQCASQSTNRTEETLQENC